MVFHRKMYLFLKLCYNSVTFFSTRCIRGHSNIMFFHSFSCSAPFFTSLYLQLDQHFLTSPNEPRKPKVKVNTTQIWNLERSSQPVDATIFTTLADSNKNYLNLQAPWNLSWATQKFVTQLFWSLAFMQVLMGINWHRCGTSHTNFESLASGVWWIPHLIEHFKVCVGFATNILVKACIWFWPILVVL